MILWAVMYKTKLGSWNKWFQIWLQNFKTVPRLVAKIWLVHVWWKIPHLRQPHICYQCWCLFIILLLNSVSLILTTNVCVVHGWRVWYQNWSCWGLSKWYLLYMNKMRIDHMCLYFGSGPYAVEFHKPLVASDGSETFLSAIQPQTDPKFVVSNCCT